MFFYSCIPSHVFRPKKDAKEVTVYLFTIIILTLLTLTWGNFDRSIKVTPSAIKITQFDGVGNFDKSLIQNFFKKIDHHLWKR